MRKSIYKLYVRVFIDCVYEDLQTVYDIDCVYEDAWTIGVGRGGGARGGQAPPQ